jgi:hypothetical protein
MLKPVIDCVEQFPSFLEQFLSYVVKILKTLKAFLTEVYLLIKPVVLFFISVVSSLVSYKFLILGIIYSGILTKTVLILLPLMSLPKPIILFLTEYSLLLNNIFLFLLSTFSEIKSELLNRETLNKELDDLKSTIVNNEEGYQVKLKEQEKNFQEKINDFSLKMQDLASSLDCQKDKVNKLTVANEQIQGELSKSKSVSSLQTVGASVSFLLSLSNSLIALFKLLKVTSSDNEEMILLLKNLKSALENYQKANIAATASARAAGTLPQITGGHISTSLGDI